MGLKVLGDELLIFLEDSARTVLQGGCWKGFIGFINFGSVVLQSEKGLKLEFIWRVRFNRNTKLR